jgi:hypothetical protein
MSSPFPPSREADLVTVGANLTQKVSAAPTTYGLTATQAAALSALYDTYVNAYNVAKAPETRSPMNIALKDDAKAALIDNMRLIAGIVQHYPQITNPMRIDLGLPPRKSEPTPTPVPAVAPQVLVKSVAGRIVQARLLDPLNPTRRGMPEGVSGASIFSFTGETAPADLNGWKFEGNTGRTSVTVEFPSSTPAGAKVWLAGFFFNPRKQAGPLSVPISANLPGGSLQQTV